MVPTFRGIVGLRRQFLDALALHGAMPRTWQEGDNDAERSRAAQVAHTTSIRNSANPSRSRRQA